MLYTKEQTEALRKASDKWYNILFCGLSDLGRSDCECCKVYQNLKSDISNNRCGNCPIKLKTGLSGCRNTPYIKWKTHYHSEHDRPPRTKAEREIYDATSPLARVFPHIVEGCPECKENAIKEYVFIKKLLAESILLRRFSNC